MHDPIELPPKLVCVTQRFTPNLAFKLKTTAEQKRAFALFNSRRNYMLRQGRHIKWYGSVALNGEIGALHREIQCLRRTIWSLLTPLSRIAEHQKTRLETVLGPEGKKAE